MADFPSIGGRFSAGDYEVGAALDPTIRSDFEAGYVQTRARFTRIPKRWPITYRDTPDADKETVEAFEATLGVGSDSFNWTDPATGDTHTVRLAGPIRYKPTHQFIIPGTTHWTLTMTLEEV